MNRISILDCTLRDGGYVNDWKFGHHVITGTYRRLDEAGTEYIEVGFIDGRRNFDADSSIVPNTDSFNHLFEGIKKKHAVPVAMIDFGTCPIENIREANTTFIDGIRVIFKKDKIDKALPFCQQIKQKGYKLFIQAVSITSYSDREILDYIDRLNEVKPFAFSIVDTYGLLDKKKLSDYFSLIDNNLDPEIRIGYHGHNNFQLAFSNTVSFLGMNTKRSLIADATVYGMGKSAGNCPIELLSQYLNKYYDSKYDVSQFLEIFDTDLLSIYQNQPWGYRYNFFISAMQNCHPDYVKYLLEKKTISASSIIEILSRIPNEKKLSFNADYIQNAYIAYQANDIEDDCSVLKIKEETYNRNILLLGPGKSIVNNAEQINDFIMKKKPFIIAINFIPPRIRADLIFIGNAKRYSRLLDMRELQGFCGNIAITSNITPFTDRKPDFVINYGTLLNFISGRQDSSLLLCLALIERIGITQVSLAGFDGFKDEKNNYLSDEWQFANDMAPDKRNAVIVEGLKHIKKSIKLEFITPSLYAEALFET